MENLENILENYSGGFDLPDARDYTTDELDGFGGDSWIELPTRVMLDEVKNHEQGNIWACTLFGSVNAFNETVKKEKISLARTWELWNEAKKRGASDTSGWYLQFALQLLKDLWEVKWYVRLDLAGHANVEKIKRAIASGHAVVTGVGTADWQKIMKTHEYSRTNKWAGHIYEYNGYDDNYTFEDGYKGWLISKNSFGENGYFWTKYSDVDVLFSQYIFENVEKISEKRRTKNLQKVFEAKIWNEERPSEIATASEIRIMVNRALATIDARISVDYRTFRSSYAHLFEEKIIRGKAKIWNTENKWSIATDEEIALMFSRAVTKNTDLNTLVLSREQVAEVIGRDFL